MLDRLASAIESVPAMTLVHRYRASRLQIAGLDDSASAIWRRGDTGWEPALEQVRGLLRRADVSFAVMLRYNTFGPNYFDQHNRRTRVWLVDVRRARVYQGENLDPDFDKTGDALRAALTARAADPERATASVPAGTGNAPPQHATFPQSGVDSTAPDPAPAAPPRPQTAPTAPGPRQVAILSVENSKASSHISGGGAPDLVREVTRGVVDTIAAEPGLVLVHQYGRAGLTNVRLDQASDTVWRGPIARREPDAEQIVELLRAEGVDLGVLVFLTIRQAGNYNAYNARTDVFGVDARTGHVYHHANTERDFDRVRGAVHEVLSAYDRQRSQDLASGVR
jgi:hypothetical protein